MTSAFTVEQIEHAFLKWIEVVMPGQKLSADRVERLWVEFKKQLGVEP